MHSEHQNLDAGQNPEDSLSLGTALGHQPVREQQKWKHQYGHVEKLEETPPRIFRIGQPGGCLDQRGAAEEVTDLDEYEGQI